MVLSPERVTVRHTPPAILVAISLSQMTDTANSYIIVRHG